MGKMDPHRAVCKEALNLLAREAGKPWCAKDWTSMAEPASLHFERHKVTRPSEPQFLIA
ncbi:MAG: hypothetical protein HY861_05215 [Chlamydiia bacterium]|nr:hypothetical protein [Chlamydiia bacterium]